MFVNRCLSLMAGAGGPEEDELFESALVESNCVYQLEEDRLLPHDQGWATASRISLLGSTQVHTSGRTGAHPHLSLYCPLGDNCNTQNIRLYSPFCLLQNCSCYLRSPSCPDILCQIQMYYCVLAFLVRFRAQSVCKSCSCSSPRLWCLTLGVRSTCGMGKTLPQVTARWRCYWLSRCGPDLMTTATAGSTLWTFQPLMHTYPGEFLQI